MITAENSGKYQTNQNPYAREKTERAACDACFLPPRGGTYMM